MSRTLHSGGDTDGGNNERAATYLVTIAGSAGALKPLRYLLSELPTALQAAVIVVVHTGEGSCLAEALNKPSKLRVCTGASGQLLTAGTVYVAPPGAHVVVNPDARLTIAAAPPVRFFRPSADWLFESAAASFGDRHVAVVLSGMLSDGAAALRTIKRHGGAVLVQSPGDAMSSEMPVAAIDTGAVDAVVPIRDMARAVCALVSRRDTDRDSAMWEAPFACGASHTDPVVHTIERGSIFAVLAGRVGLPK